MIVNKKLIFEVIDAAAAAKTKKEKVKILQENDTWALKDVLRATYDDGIQFTLPPGSPPYEENEISSIPSNLLKQHKKFTYIVKGGKGDQIQSFKREKMFIDMLEAVHPEDAKLLIKMKDKQSLGKGITKKLVQEAYPGLIIK